MEGKGLASEEAQEEAVYLLTNSLAMTAAARLKERTAAARCSNSGVRRTQTRRHPSCTRRQTRTEKVGNT